MLLSFIIENYFNLPVAIGLGSICVIALYLIFKKPSASRRHKFNTRKKMAETKSTHSPLTITSHDITAIAGDDVMATQLDLARAYIETGRKLLAKKILEHVIEQGSYAQQNEAKNLLGLI